MKVVRPAERGWSRNWKWNNARVIPWHHYTTIYCAEVYYGIDKDPVHQWTFFNKWLFFICFSVKFWGLQGVCSSLREKPYNHLKIRDFSYPSPFHWRTFTFVCHFKYNLMPSKTWRAQHGRHVVADGLIPPHWQHIATLRSGQWTYGPSLVMWGLLFIRRTLSNVSSLRI